MEKIDTKNKLLQSAVKEFAKNGFFGATTRDIAKRADINISSIVYYFGGKKGIYTAVLANIVDTIKDLTTDMSEQYDLVMEKNDATEALDLLKNFTQRFLFLLCSGKISKDMKTLFFGEYWKPTDDFGILYDGVIFPFQKMFAELLTLACDNKIDIKDSYLYTFPIFAQLFVFSSRKRTICSLMEWQDYNETEKEKLLKYVTNQIDNLVTGD